MCGDFLRRRFECFRVMFVYFSFLFFLLAFLGIGLWSSRFAGKSTRDYLLAGKSVPPALVGLSAIATNNSGFMFTGMIGTTYAMGLSSLWMMFGWIVGDLTVSFFGVKAIRRRANDERVESFGALLGYWQGRHDRVLQRLAGGVTIVVLTLYASGQLIAGSKAASVLLGWPSVVGVAVGGVIILSYSAFGGIRASIWTDAAQSVVMASGMFVLVAVGLHSLGGWNGIEKALALEGLPADYLDVFPAKPAGEVFLFIAGWLFAGLGVLGQPHVVVRYMCLDSEKNVSRMRLYYYGWYVLFCGFTMAVGLLSRLLFLDAEQFDQELALLKLTQEFLPGIFAGVILAALFAAAMSTADSIILSCSAALTRDLLGGKKNLAFAKAMTALVLTAAGLFAVSGKRSVFNVVLDAWNILGSAFVPLLLFLLSGKRCSQNIAVAGCLLGMLTCIAARQSDLWPEDVEPIAPGILVGLGFLLLANGFSRHRRRQ